MVCCYLVQLVHSKFAWQTKKKGIERESASEGIEMKTQDVAFSGENCYSLPQDTYVLPSVIPLNLDVHYLMKKRQHKSASARNHLVQDSSFQATEY